MASADSGGAGDKASSLSPEPVPDVVRRLTDTSKYTGTHAERFNSDGTGRVSCTRHCFFLDLRRPWHCSLNSNGAILTQAQCVCVCECCSRAFEVCTACRTLVQFAFATFSYCLRAAHVWAYSPVMCALGQGWPRRSHRL